MKNICSWTTVLKCTKIVSTLNVGKIRKYEKIKCRLRPRNNDDISKYKPKIIKKNGILTGPNIAARNSAI